MIGSAAGLEIGPSRSIQGPPEDLSRERSGRVGRHCRLGLAASGEASQTPGPRQRLDRGRPIRRQPAPLVERSPWGDRDASAFDLG